jgi:hypothetical protein
MRGAGNLAAATNKNQNDKEMDLEELAALADPASVHIAPLDGASASW